MQISETCNVHSDDMRAKNVTQFSTQWMYCSQGLCEGATPGHKQRLQVMSRTVPPCHSERKVVWTRRSLYSLSAFNNRSILIFHTPSECDGAQWLSIIKTSYFGSPPPPFFKKFHKIHKIDKFIKFHKIFFFGPRPSIQKITNANTNTDKDRKDNSHIFYREMIQILHLADNWLTPCWQLHKCNNLTFLTFFQGQRFSYSVSFFQVQWPNTF